MIAPVGTFKEMESADVEEVGENWGIFPRCVFEVLKAFEKAGLNQESDYVLTVKVSESTWKDPLCLLTKKLIKLDPVTDEFIAGHEIPIKSTKDIIEVCKLIEVGRSRRATKMNADSSRTHCIIEL